MTVYEDWGERCERWAGVRSEVRRLGVADVHLLRADGPADGVPQLLVHGLGGAATNWLEVLPALAAHGPVVAPDLPGFGRTEPPHPRAARVTANVGFLAALLRDLGWDRAVVHGNSMGGMLSVLLADRAPERVAGLVLAAPALPFPRARLHRLDPVTIARFLPFVIPRFGRLVLRLMRSRVAPEVEWRQLARFLYGDPQALPAEVREVGIENIVHGRDTHWRLPAFVAAAESLVSLLLRSGQLRRAIDRVPVPGTVVWGEGDRLVSRVIIDHLAERRPDWELHAIHAVGHVPMAEAPGEYVEAVGRFLTARRLAA